MRVSSDMPDDILVLHDALETLQNYKSPIVLHLKNCGTALRFLQVHLQKCYPNDPITLTGDPRLMERDGKPTSQTHSALLMHGVEVEDDSPYVEMTRRVIANYPNVSLESDWSAAAFWYEYVAIHGGSLLLEGLTSDSLQGDKVVADIYAKYFGVETEFVDGGAKVKKSSIFNLQSSIAIDFVNCIDLYPAVALTCEKLSIELHASGTDRLRFKESDRLEAVRLHEVRNDHRIAMALMAADFSVSESDQQCIAKSYPSFSNQYRVVVGGISGQYRGNIGSISDQYREMTHITPIRGVNDEGKGKKFALSKLIHSATSDYLWLHDDDVILPKASNSPQGGLTTQWSNSVSGLTGAADLVILPLKMESESDNPSLLEKLQIAEYAAIQELTMRTAKRGRAVMCSGANLIVRREVWLACESQLHPEIPSGDDMFLLEAAKRAGYTVGAIDDPDYTAIVRPLTSWRAFFRQRMRWAGKAPHYTDPDIRLCGLLISLANIAQLLCPPILLIKFPIEYSLIRAREKAYTVHPTPYTLHPTPSTKKPRTPWYVALLLELIYPFYILFVFLGGLVRTSRW